MSTETTVSLAQAAGDAAFRNAFREVQLLQLIEQAADWDVITEAVAAASEDVWRQAKTAVAPATLWVPLLDIMDDGRVMFTWNRGESFVLDVEIPDGAPVEWFWRNRETGATGDWEGDTGTKLPPEVVTQLQRFAF